MRNNSKRILTSSSDYPEFSLPFKYEDLPNGIDVSHIISSEYGDRMHPTKGVPKYHAGLDFLLPNQTPVYAPCDAKIIRVIEGNSGFGNVVIGDYNGENNFLFLCAHLSNVEISKENLSQNIKAGDLIGYSGNTGNGRIGYHLHFEIIKGNEVVTLKGETKTAWRWVTEHRTNSRSIGLDPGVARIGPRLFFEHLSETIFPNKVKYANKQISAEGESRSNIYVGNGRDNGYFDGVDAREYASSKTITPPISASSSLSSKITSSTDLYKFNDRSRIRRDVVYDGDLDGRIEIEGNLINNATLSACVIESSTGDYSETTWKLINGDHDKSGLEYIATRVDDDGILASDGDHLRITINSAEETKEAVSNSITIAYFDFTLAESTYCFGMKLGGYGTTITETVYNNLVYADNDKFMSYPKAVGLPDGGMALMWYYRGSDVGLQVKVINADYTARSGIVDVDDNIEGFNAYFGSDICLADDGGFAVIWQYDPSFSDDDNKDYSLNIRYFSKDGIATSQTVTFVTTDGNFGVSNAHFIRAAYLANGNIVVIYNLSEDSERDDGIYAIELDGVGKIMREEIALLFESSIMPEKFYEDVEVVALVGGGYTIVYECPSNDRCGVFKLTVSADGEIGDEILISEGDAKTPEIVATADGGCLVSWEEVTGTEIIAYAQVFAADDSVLYDKFAVLVSERATYIDKLLMLKNGGAVFAWIDTDNNLRAQLYNSNYRIQKENFFVTTDEYTIQTFTMSQLGDGFTIAWSDLSYKNGQLGVDIKGAVYNNNGLRLYENYTSIISTTRKQCIEIGSSAADQITLSDLPVYGREGADKFIVSTGNANAVQDFAIGEDKLLTSSLEVGTGRRANLRRRLWVESGLYVNATKDGDNTLLAFGALGEGVIATVNLTGINPIDLASADFKMLNNASLPLNILAEGIGIRGNEVGTYIEDHASKLPPLQVSSTRIDEGGNITVIIDLDDDFGFLSVGMEKQMLGLQVSYNETLNQLILRGNVTSVNRALANTSFVPYQNVNEAITATFNVSDGVEVRSVVLRINGITVNDAPILNPYLLDYTATEGENVTIPIANMSDVDSSVSDFSLQFFIKQNDRFICLGRNSFTSSNIDEYHWFKSYFDDTSNIITNFTAPELDSDITNKTYFFKYRGSDGESYSDNASFALTVVPAKYSSKEVVEYDPTIAPSRINKFPTTTPSFGMNNTQGSSSPPLFNLGNRLIIAGGAAGLFVFCVLAYCGFRKYRSSANENGTVRENHIESALGEKNDEVDIDSALEMVLQRKGTAEQAVSEADLASILESNERSGESSTNKTPPRRQNLSNANTPNVPASSMQTRVTKRRASLDQEVESIM